MPISKNKIDYQKIGIDHQELLIEKITQDNEVSRHHAITILNGLGFVENQKPIVCELCPNEKNKVNTGDGLILKECLHHFCKKCLSTHIHSVQTSTVPCPFKDGVSKCSENLNPSEVEALVSKAEYDRHYVDLFLKEIKATCKDAFHCRKANCRGFCIPEKRPTPQYFDCPVCGTENCLECKEAHGWRMCPKFKFHEKDPEKSSSCNIL